MLDHGELEALLDSWLLRLQAERKSARTVKSYRQGVGAYLAYCTDRGVPAALDRGTVAAFTAHLLDTGKAAATARLYQLAVRRFSGWLADEDEIDTDRLLGMKPPQLDQGVVPELSDEECRALIKACAGKRLSDKRDEAIVRLMLETGVRIGEVLAMNTADQDLARGTAVVRRGKGGKGRTVMFGPMTGSAIDRYLRARRRHKRRESPELWLGEHGWTLGYDGLKKSLERRARAAGIKGFHPHMLRHTFAGRWLDAGGTEQGLMVTAGWSRREMIDRYSRATSERRAHDEARRLGLGDL